MVLTLILASYMQINIIEAVRGISVADGMFMSLFLYFAIFLILSMIGNRVLDERNGVVTRNIFVVLSAALVSIILVTHPVVKSPFYQATLFEMLPYEYQLLVVVAIFYGLLIKAAYWTATRYHSRNPNNNQQIMYMI